MKIALIQDQLLTPAGSERVFLYMVEEFQEADVYTLAFNEKTTWPEYKNYNIQTSILNPLIRNHNTFKYFFPISTLIMQTWNFSDYDILLTSSATTAKYIKRYNGKHICYCYTPTRAIWDADEYFAPNKISSKIKKALLQKLKRRDITSTKNISRLLTQSEYSKNNIKKIYARDSEVVPPPIEYNKFHKAFYSDKSDSYLIVSRLEKWKKLEFAIQAFNGLGYQLKIIGSGSEESFLRSISAKNIEFLGSVDDSRLVEEYGRARAVIFTPELEYGLIPIEANAAGTVVIAYGKGAVWETMIPYSANNTTSKFSAIFFKEQNSSSLIGAIKTERKLDIDRNFISRYAKKYDIKNYKNKLRKIVEEEYHNI
jgi:glycosyltransferase involved in cell wall biosynthesis